MMNVIYTANSQGRENGKLSRARKFEGRQRDEISCSRPTERTKTENVKKRLRNKSTGQYTQLPAFA